MDTLPLDTVGCIIVQMDVYTKCQTAKTCKRMNKRVLEFKSNLNLEKTVLVHPFLPEKEVSHLKAKEAQRYFPNYTEQIYWNGRIIGFIKMNYSVGWCGYVSLFGTTWESFSLYRYLNGYTDLDGLKKGSRRLKRFIGLWLRKNKTMCDNKTKQLLDCLREFDDICICKELDFKLAVGWHYRHFDDKVRHPCREKVIHDLIAIYHCTFILNGNKHRELFKEEKDFG